MHSALQREKLTAANRTVLSSQLAFHAMQRRRFLENSALASLPLFSSLALLPGCAVYERNIHSDDRPSADAPAGRFRGVRQPDTSIQVYLGIPFMKNPYEPVRRFLAPQPMERIADTLDCVKHGALPLQPGPDGAMIGGDGPLCLNIWVPRDATPRSRFPVMVWVPGGGSIRCAQNDERFDGTHFAAHGCILVTLAYRVNIDGFLKIRGGDSNLGVRDIIMGLRWVKDNIAAFGGDPENVTIFGQSGGGMKVATLMNTPAADGLFQKGIIESGVYEAKVYQKEDGDGTAIVKALLKELNLDESEVEKLETIPYYELSNAYNKVEAEVAAKGCYIGQGPMENGWFHGNPIKCGFTDHAKTIPVLAGTNIGEFDFGPVVPGKHEMNREEQIAFLTRKYGDATPELISLFEKAYPDKTIADLWSVDTFFRPATIEFIRQKSEFTEAPTYSYQFTYEFPIDGGKAAWHCAEIPFVFHNIDRIAVCNVPGETDRLQERMATAWINFARYGSPETPSLPNWPACTPGDEATMIFDRTCEIRRNFDHELVKKLVETEYNPMTPVVEDEEEDAFFIH